MHTLDTPRLQLRPWTLADAAPFARFYADATQARFVGGQKDEEMAWRHLALLVGHWQLKGYGYWAVEERASGLLAGCVGLWQSPAWPEMELGYWIMPEHQGQGFAVEAGRASIDFARTVLQAPSLVSYIDPANQASIRVASALGAHCAGLIELASFGPHAVYCHYGDGLRPEASLAR